MGMTDLQFKAHIRGLIHRINKALEITPENEELIALLAELKATLED